jgi:magnesium and cobalt transporter
LSFLNGNRNSVDGLKCFLANIAEPFKKTSEFLLLCNTLESSEVMVADIMTPRADIAAVDEMASYDDLFKIFCQSGHSKLPVFKGGLDNCVGIVRVKNILSSHAADSKNEKFRIDSYILRCLFIPPSMPIFSLLHRMKTDRMDFALVIDEYGGVDGVVTIKDIMDRIIGEVEISCERDAVEYWFDVENNAHVCDARMSIEEFYEKANRELLTEDMSSEDVDTLGGLVCMLCERVPKAGEIISHPSGHKFEVIDASARCIFRLRVWLKKEMTI